jgi:two-component system chemotaxis response regulator CheB
VKKIKVLVVDDSAAVRQALTKVLNSDPGIEVTAAAADPFFAVQKMEQEVPDVITLDVEMPRMDGITFLRKIMTQHPIPVVICSSLTEKGAETTLKAMEYGAVEIIQKPKLGARQFLEEARIRICDAVKAAAKVKIGKIAVTETKVRPKLTADAVIPEVKSRAMARTTEKIAVIGASTGGTEALRVFLETMPLDAPGLVIVLHMPEGFTAAFAKRMDSLCRITVKEGKDGDHVIPGRAIIAPGNKHMLLKRSGALYYVEIKEGPLVSRHRPSVDVLFRSSARYAGKNAVGIILTGMGDDGAKGMLEMHQAGAHTIAQDENSCIVFGMPKEAINLGGVDKVLPLQGIPPYLLRICRN